MSAPALPRVYHLATSIDYAAGSNPWNAQPTKTKGAGDWVTYGWTPGSSPPANWMNDWMASISHGAEDAQINAITKVVASGADTTYRSAVGALRMSRQVIRLTKPGATQLFEWSNAQVTKVTDSGTDAAYPDYAILCDWSSMSDGSLGALYFMSKDPGGQTVIGIAFDVPRTIGGAVNKATGVPASTNGGWIDYVSPYPGTSVIVDVQGARTFTNGAWTGYSAFAATDYSTCAKIPSTDPTAYPGGIGSVVCVFGPTHTAISTVNATTVAAWVEHAATWDGAAIPASCIPFRPFWDTANGRWVVGVAHIDTAAHARQTGRVYISTDGFTWTTIAAAPSFVLVHGIEHRGVLYGIGYMPDDSANPLGRDSDALEAVLSIDGGATWQRLGEAGVIGVGATASTLASDCRVLAGSDCVTLTTTINGHTEYVVLQTAAG